MSRENSALKWVQANMSQRLTKNRCGEGPCSAAPTCLIAFVLCRRQSPKRATQGLDRLERIGKRGGSHVTWDSAYEVIRTNAPALS